MDANDLKMLVMGTAGPDLDPGFDYFLVKDNSQGGTAAAAALVHVGNGSNPAVTKLFLPKKYTLIINGGILYWQVPKPTARLLPLTRGTKVADVAGAGLDTGFDWYEVAYRLDDDVVYNKSYLTKNPTATPAKEFETEPHTLVLHADTLYWKTAIRVKATGIVCDPNPTFDWLHWETRVNAAEYQKNKVALAYGLYAVPLDQRAEVVAAYELPEILCQAFFPGMSVSEVQAISEQSCRWRGGKDKAGTVRATSLEELPAARTETVIHAPQMMILPYNYYANDESSYSIGTNLAAEIVPGPAFRLQKVWPLWESASRSSVSSLTPTLDEDLAKAQRLGEQWTYRSKTPPGKPEMPPEYKDKPFQMGKFTDCYSVKTGVRWLGKVAQGSGDPGGGKDVLESNALLASMRSDWVEHVEATVGTAPSLIVLRELLTVTYPNNYRGTRDGYQIRDLRPLDTKKIYFPPLSIPFGGQEFVDAYNTRHKGHELDFETFWREAYAKPLGKAKAELLLRYGMQLTTPNPQNFLLEFDATTLEPTGVVVIRDIGDAKIHSEVIQQIGMDQPVIQYELTNPERPGYLPAQTNNADRADDHARHDRLDQYPLDTRTHWHQYSTFKDKYGGKYLPNTMMTTVRWGRAHYEAYVDHLATRLEHPALRLPIFGKAAYDRLAVTTEIEPNLSKGEAAKKVLTEALLRVKGDHSAVTPALYETLISEKKFSESEIVYTEWVWEVHTDEVLHALLSKPEVLLKVKQKWV
jgi:hypothetical protein